MDPPLSPNTFSNSLKKDSWRYTLLLSFQSIGIVYGRLSTAPLYVFETLSTIGDHPSHAFKSEETVYELFSFIFWTLTIVSLLKYAFIVLKADDDGEGGPFALYSLLCRHAKVGLLPNDKSVSEVTSYDVRSPSMTKFESRARRAIQKRKSSHYLMLLLALFGSCMMISDGVLTPAISVLSASQGLQRSLSDMARTLSSSHDKQEELSEYFKKYVPVPLACAILVCLFTLQHYGTHKIGFIFAPVIILWLFFIGGVGFYNILHCNPHIFYAISPTYLYRFVKKIDKDSWSSLRSILLCVAGSEAMFADLGHFSKKSIKMTFVSVIYPILILCYAGQAAFISKHLNASDELIHLSTSMPGSFRHIFVALSLIASAVGSQATITASFSIINQCLALDCFPRVKVIHTSDTKHGQVYIPDVNWSLMILSLTVTIAFHQVVRIANAAGLAIVLGMLVTTCLMSLVIALYWEMSLFVSASFLIFFGFIEFMYLSACMLNFHKGAWFLVVHCSLTLIIMLSWHYGTKKKYEFDIENKVSTEWLTDLSPGLGVSRLSGIGFVHSDIVTGIPAFFSHFITNLPAFHQVLIFVSFKSLPVPYVPSSRRYLIGRVGAKDYKIYRCIVRYGYCDSVRDTDDFEDQIIKSIGEFISLEENDPESLTSAEGRMIVIGKPMPDGHALIPLLESHLDDEHTNNGSQKSPLADSIERDYAPAKPKKVRFTLQANSPKIHESVREELQELMDARESGTAHFLGQSHLAVRDGSSFLKRLLVMIYVFLDKNSRKPPVALNIPHAALVEVGMIYTI
ncbi:potassium transporter 25-like [Mangifera indica]|uniref:potassium transporter 25-like n=1 Tax=Mangifera indica TaxID=29780 RepID=UPI001CFACEB7|nr:potassium transporter 25-like [Mangifera indica]XP_044477229.1 potassium transporter 25-like [Mangifera indica]